MTELRIETHFINNSVKPICQKIDNSQHVTFKFDNFIKGQRVAMTLTSPDGKALHAPQVDIYFNNYDLKKILEFLIESEK